MAQRVTAVFGGSGFIGTYVARALCKAGHRVRVATRRPHLANDLRVVGDVGQVQLVQANVRNRSSIQRALEGVDSAVYLVGVLAQSGSQTFSALQAEGPGTVAQEAAAAGVERFVHISAIGADEDSPSQYARTKADGEANVRAAFPSATILRPSIVFGPEDEFFNRFADMARFAPALPLIGGGKTRFQPVYVADVAAAVAASLDRSDAAGRTYELGGPRVYTFKELLQFMLEVIDRKRLLAPVPWAAAHMLGYGGQLAGALPFIQPFLTNDQVILLKSDNVVAEGAPGLADLAITPETIEAIVPSYLERYRKHGQFHERAD